MSVPDATEAPPVAAQPPATGAMVAGSNSERRIIVLGATLTVCLCLFAIIGSLCWLVVRDGNSALVSDVTTKLTFVALGSLVAMVAALFGSNSVVSKVLDKVL